MPTTTSTRDRTRTLLAEVDTVCAHLDSAGPAASDKAHEHREQLDRDLAALVPDLLAELDAAAVPATRIHAGHIAPHIWPDLHAGPAYVRGVATLCGRVVVAYRYVDSGRGVATFLPDVEVAQVTAPAGAA